MSFSRIAVVTGANKGIGYEICKALCNAQKDMLVVLAARNESRGVEAVNTLKREGCENIEFQQLDITNDSSIKQFEELLRKKYQKIDILVNNAGFAYSQSSTAPIAEQAHETVGINFFGTLRVLRALLPVIRDRGRVVNVGSQAGLLSNIRSKELEARFRDDNLTVEGLEALMREYLHAVDQGQYVQRGWPTSTYSTSKIGVNILSRILPKEIERFTQAKGITVNVMCPGWCKSDMAGWDAPPRTAAQGADTAVWLALLPSDDRRTGKFFYDRRERDW